MSFHIKAIYIRWGKYVLCLGGLPTGCEHPKPIGTCMLGRDKEKGTLALHVSFLINLLIRKVAGCLNLGGWTPGLNRNEKSEMHRIYVKKID